MKPPRFSYHDPTTVDEALGLLTRHGDATKILAGGQSCACDSSGGAARGAGGRDGLGTGA